MRSRPGRARVAQRLLQVALALVHDRDLGRLGLYLGVDRGQLLGVGGLRLGQVAQRPVVVVDLDLQGGRPGQQVVGGTAGQQRGHPAEPPALVRRDGDRGGLRAERVQLVPGLRRLHGQVGLAPLGRVEPALGVVVRAGGVGELGLGKGEAESAARPRLWAVNLAGARPARLPNWALGPLRSNRPVVPVEREITFKGDIVLYGQERYSPPHRIRMEVDGKAVRDLPPPGGKLGATLPVPRDGKVPFSFSHPASSITAAFAKNASRQ